MLVVSAATDRNIMTKAPSETPDLSPVSMHFQILLAGSVIFLIALFWLTDLPHTNTSAARSAVAASQLITGIRILSSYLAFAIVVLGHGMLVRRARPSTEEQE